MTEFDFGLGESVDLLRRTVRDFASELIAPRAAEIEARQSFPRDLWPELGALGLLGITVETEHGGNGLGCLEHVVAMEEISRASPAVGLAYGAHSGLCVGQIRRWGDERQKRTYLPALISGQHVGALAVAEPEGGSDIAGLRLQAELRGSHYLLNGRKVWVTNGPEADVIVVYGRTDERAGPPGLTAFLVEKGFSGYRIGPVRKMLGMHGAAACELIFDDCRVPVENVLHEPGKGLEVLQSALDEQRVVLAGGPLGIMRAALDMLLPHVRQREQFGQPIGAFQLMQARLADLYTSLNASRAYVYGVARAHDRGQSVRHDAAGCLLFASERATQCALQLMQAFGGEGYGEDLPAARLLRDAKVYEIAVGTSDMSRLLIGRGLFETSDE